MQKTGTAFVAGLLFLAAGICMLFSVQPVWWSIVSVVIVFAAAVLFFVSSVRLHRRSQTSAE